jgi:signal transduction histidine kinase/CheY-like chemotaxis protein/HPt (histidine-containing phosphotransfer) domain-containing protein
VSVRWFALGKSSHHEYVEHPRQNYRSLSSKFSIFTAVLVLWVVGTILCWDVIQHTFNLMKGIVLFGVVGVVAFAISRFTMKLLARPLSFLQAGITSVREGRFEPIQVSRTGDEIEYLGESFNRMIETLAASQDEIRQHQELLELRIRQRTGELEKAMHAALAGSQAKSEFLANMSHELRTPMNGLLGMVDLVLDSGLSSDQREQLETAQRCAYSLLALLNDILDLSKIEAGKMLLEKIPFNISEVLQDCVKSQSAKAAQKRIELHCEADASSAYEVLGDPLRIRQIVANLLSNAIKFTERGWVRVSLAGKTTADGRIELEIKVADTGSGIPADKLPAIFEKFTQADGSITRKYGGTGLGLAITRRLVKLQGGEVSVESQPGHGSTFKVTLTCEAAPERLLAPDPAAGNGAGAAASTPGARLLLVEDNVVNQKVVLAILRKKGYQIDVANHGREALARLEAPDAAYNLILMDVQMPVLDGLETTRCIRRDSRWENIPIIAMTAHAMNGDRERCLQAGMDAYISKPVQPAHLISTIEKHLAAPAVRPREFKPLDRNVTDRLQLDDSGLVNGILQLFLQLAPERIDRLAEAANNGDIVTLDQEAKMIGAAAKQLASTGLSECARRIEEAAAKGDFDQVKRDLGMLRQEVQSLEALTI